MNCEWSVNGWPMGQRFVELFGDPSRVERVSRSARGSSPRGRPRVAGRIALEPHGSRPRGTSSRIGSVGRPSVCPRATGRATGRSSPSIESELSGTGDIPRRPMDGLATLSSEAVVTWLILPVVICLSQRLSHACLSISNYTAKLRMAH